MNGQPDFGDPKARVNTMKILAGVHPIGIQEVTWFLEALADPDPEVVEWAMVGLRRCRGDVAESAKGALWRILLDEDQRESTRSYAMNGLEKLGARFPAEDLEATVWTLREDRLSILATSIVHSTGLNGCTKGECEALVQLRTRLDEHVDRELHSAVNAALVRCAKQAIIQGTVTSPDLTAMGADDIRERLGERRIRAEIDAAVADKAQSRLFAPNEDESDVPALPEHSAGRLPGQTLVDVMERQYIQDVAAYKNARIVERIEPVRDRALAKEAKRRAGFKCQVCGATAPPGYRKHFVHAHHAQPLGEGGADAESNIVALCPNCHTRAHTGEIQIRVVRTRQGGVGFAVRVEGARKAYTISKETPADQDSLQADMRAQAIVESFRELPGRTQREVLSRIEALIHGGGDSTDG